MAKLLALRMRGIRSIGDEEHVIDFLDPLTIIQGPNGTGKTTTIEALNYITTGALPTGKLATFIHNNKLANKNRVDALIQMKFISCDGREVTATKRMASVVKGAKSTNKSDEYTILIKDKFGNETSLSSKVTDFNKEMVNFLGVPKAILDNVIFCHQEESNWPLSEPKELKARFDAIFDVTRYVKAIDYVKKMIKELETEIRSIDAELPYLKGYIQDKINEKQKLEHYLDKIEENRKKIEQNNKLSEDLQVELELVRNKLADVKQVQIKLASLKPQVQMYREQKRSLNVPDFPGTEDDIRVEISKLLNSQDFNNAETERQTIEEEAVKVDSELLETSKKIREHQNDLNRASAEDMRRKELVKERSDFSEQVYLKYGIIPDADFNTVLLKKKSVMDVELVDFRKSVQKEQEEITNVANQAREIIATQKSMEAMKKSELSRLAPAIAKLEFELSKAETEDSAPAISQDSVPLEDPPVNLPMGVRRKEDYTNGYADGYKSGYITGYSRGYADGRALQMTTLRKNLEEKKAQKASLLKEIEEIRHTLPQHQAELKENEQKLAKLNQEARGEEQRKTNEINELDGFRMQLLQIDSKLGNLKDNFDLIDSLQRKVQQLNESVQTLQNKKAMLERRMTSISSKQHEKRVLEDQLKKMEITQKLAALEPELAQLSAQFQSCQELEKKELSLNKQCLDLDHAVHRMSGEQGELSKRVDEIRRKLNEARYRDAQKAYRDKFIEKVCRMKSIDDLNKYWKIVDDMIIEFHRTKMEQINYILQDLWAKVYQGNDIETIKIKSEAVGKDEKKKSYDYSVVMTIDQVDIDMRDRCSAGQKVLASILIRIALAEVFGGHCPILALDEPTTNLDSEKIDNIAITLKRLIAHSSSSISSFRSNGNSSNSNQPNRRNLQLIVITHDQRLVDHLYLACRPEYTYGLSKDETGVSHIRMHQRLMDSQALYNA